MDVNMINRNQEYLKSYTTAADISKYSDAQAVVQNNSKVVSQSHENEKNKDSASKEKDKFTKEDLDKALKKLNKFMEDDKTHAEYEKHKELGTVMVRIVDEKTDEVILEAPPKKILDMVASMCEQVGILDKKA